MTVIEIVMILFSWRILVMKSLGSKPLLFPMPVLIIASYNEDGSVNAMNMAWGGVSDDTKVSLNLAPDHKTAENIRKRRAFTISVADGAHMKEADFFGIASGNKVADKFSRSGLSAVKSELVDAPVITDFPLTLECSVSEITERPSLSHVEGEILNVLVHDDILDDKGRVDVRKLDGLIFDTFTSGYYRVGDRIGTAWKEGAELMKNCR